MFNLKSRGKYLYFVSITRKGHGMKLGDDILIKRYDHGMKLARTDYKPIDLNNPTDPLANRFMQIQEYRHRNTEVLMILYVHIIFALYIANSKHSAIILKRHKSVFNPGREFERTSRTLWLASPIRLTNSLATAQSSC